MWNVLTSATIPVLSITTSRIFGTFSILFEESRFAFNAVSSMIPSLTVSINIITLVVDFHLSFSTDDWFWTWKHTWVSLQSVGRFTSNTISIVIEALAVGLNFSIFPRIQHFIWFAVTLRNVVALPGGVEIVATIASTADSSLIPGLTVVLNFDACTINVDLSISALNRRTKPDASISFQSVTWSACNTVSLEINVPTVGLDWEASNS